MAPPRLFGVITWGNAGSMWLARLLNSHPGIVCLHHLKGQWADILGQKRIDDVRYFDVIARQGRAYALAGDVHGVELESLARLKARHGDRFRAAVLVRHPLPRILSHLRSVSEKGRRYYGLNYRALRRGLSPGLREVLHDEERLFFVHVMGLVNRVVAEQDAAPVFTLEDLSREPSGLARLLAHLSDGSVSAGPLLDSEVWHRPVNSRFPEATAGRDPRAAFDALPDWGRAAFSALLDPAARAAYDALGYDLSFV